MFRLLDRLKSKPVIWLSGMPGAGKTTLVVSYLKSRKISCIYYHIDESDRDLAAFFYYMNMAFKHAVPGNGAAGGYERPLSLLTPEYLQDIPAFTRRYFNELYRRVNRKKRFAIVFDNYQDVPTDSQLHSVISTGVSIQPAGIHIVIISKGSPPAAFTPLRMGNKMGFVTDKEMRFTLSETAGLLHHMKAARVCAATSKQFHDRVEGWTAGLVLLMEEYRKGPDQRQPALPGKEPLSEGLFGYFAEHIFNRLDKGVQDFLLKTSFLTKVTADTAKKITGVKHTEDILEYLYLNNYFTMKLPSPEPAYQYHSLFREFLLSHAGSSFAGKDIRFLRVQAAGLLEQSGEFEEAARLFSTAGEWHGFARLIIAHAPSLLAQGRNQLLLQWFKRLDQSIIDKDPWLSYWYGLSLFPFSLTESRRNLEKSFALFKVQSDTNGVYLSWANVVRTYCVEWNSFKPVDSWIDAINAFLAHTPFPSGEVGVYFVSTMFLALLYRNPRYRTISPWLKRAEEIVQSGSGTDMRTTAMMGNYIMLYYSWTGDIARMDILMDTLRPLFRNYSTKQDTVRLNPNEQGIITPFETILWQVVESIYAWLTLSTEASSAIDAGLAAADRYGLHLWDHMLYAQGAYYALTTGDAAGAGTYLDNMYKSLNGNNALDISHYYYLKSYYSHLQGNLPVAVEYAESALRSALQAGAVFPEIMCRLGLAQVQLSTLDYRHARENMAIAGKLGISMRSVMSEYCFYLLDARLSFEQGDEKKGIQSLRQGMKIGREQGYINHWCWMHETMLFLCIKALRYGIEVRYVQTLIKRRNLVPENTSFSMHGVDSIIDIETWPWELELYTLGSFELMTDGKPLRFSDKTRTMPLHMLKVLIAFGGTDVREESITDVLWPDAEGDRAHTAFSTTLQRLRQFIGSDACIKLKEGRLSLDPRYCRVDAWAFERLLDNADPLWRTGGDEAAKLTERAADMYKGGFLPNDTYQWWTTSMRERMRSKFVRALNRLGHYYEERGKCEKAAEYYVRGLEVDNLSEEFYQSLMLCYRATGRRAEALAVYHKCRSILHDILNVEPSPKTESIYAEIKSSPG